MKQPYIFLLNGDCVISRESRECCSARSNDGAECSPIQGAETSIAFTLRQFQVAALLAHPNKRIAFRLQISISRVEKLVAVIARKLGAENRTDAALKFAQMNQSAVGKAA